MVKNGPESKFIEEMRRKKKSPEKVLEFIEELLSFSDEELAQAMPVPIAPALLRGGLAAAAGQVPGDPEVLDELLCKVGFFCLSLRSDAAVEITA